MSKKLKLSPWHDGSVKPVHVGMYQLPNGYRFWNGKKWMWYGETQGSAIVNRNADSFVCQQIKWRGVLK